LELQKRRVTKADGRYILYYAFDRHFPEVFQDQTADQVVEKGTDARPAADTRVGKSGPGSGKGGDR